MNYIIDNSSSASATETACDSYTWAGPLGDGGTYTTSGIYTHVSTNGAGCNHTETLNLQINNSTSNTANVTECDTYTWAVNGITYATSGTYVDVNTNAAGCTNTDTLVLTINTSTSTNTPETACDSYTW